MKLVVEAAHLNYLMANAITIPAGSVVNFVVSDRLVFGERDQESRNLFAVLKR